MKRSKLHLLALVLLIASLSLAGCSAGPAETASEEVPPAQVEHLNGPEMSRITLTEDAAKRIDVQTDTVQTENIGGVERTVIPYASILYDTDGNTWVYTSPDALTYVRTPVKVDSIQGDDAVVIDGPAAGTTVVTVGAEELYGSETEFEEE